MSNQPPYGAPNQFGMPQGPGQQPKKSNAALIAAIVALVLVVAAVVIALVFTLNKDDDNDSSGSDDQSSKSESTDPESESTDPESESADVPSDDQISGDGYSYTLSSGWSDRDADLGSAPDSVDTVAAWGTKLQGSRANLLVEVADPNGATSPEALKDTWIKNLSQSLDTKPKDTTGITLDGTDAIGVRIERKNENGVDIVQLAYLTVHDGKAYTVGLSTTPDSEGPAKDAFDEMIATWSWS